MGASWDLQGVDHLVDSLHDAGATLEQLPALDDAGQLLEARGVAAAPKRTGHLAETVGSTVAGDTVTVFATAPYAVFVHARNPWLSRTLASSEDDVQRLIEDDVQRAVDSIRGV